jgi:hypothetical protein
VSRFMEISLDTRGVSCVARLLDDEAPRTCDAVWEALPLSNRVWHAKYASNELYCMVPPLASDPGLENPTITPIPADVIYFRFPTGQFLRSFRESRGIEGWEAVIDLAVFYGRNNFLWDPSVGPVPGNVYATIVEGYEAFAAACHDVYLNGSEGETLSYRRIEGRS